MPSFNYYYVRQSNGTFEIDNIGEFALSCINDNFCEYLFIVETKEGFSKIIQYGPQIIDQESDYTIPRTFIYDYQQFNPAKLEKAIDIFVNDRRKGITQVNVLSVEEALSRIVNMKELFLDGS